MPPGFIREHAKIRAPERVAQRHGNGTADRKPVEKARRFFIETAPAHPYNTSSCRR